MPSGHPSAPQGDKPPMSNLALYRKYRPKTFKEVSGQEHVVKTITNAIAQNLLSHGYLFAGPHGCGKTTMARLLAKSLNCLNRKSGEDEPCNNCDSCNEINQGNAIDIIEIDAASNRGIDEIRDLKEGIRFRPAKSKYKIFIIDEAHQLTKEAANALLKTLEEPPSHAIFILATTEAHKMIPTILSRCQRFDFRKLKMPEIIARLEYILKQENIAFDNDVLNVIAAQASGAMRDAQTLLDEVICLTGQDNKIELAEVKALLGLSDNGEVLQFLGFLKQKQIKEGFEFLSNLLDKAVDLKEFVKALIQYSREILLFRIDQNSQSPLIMLLTSEEKKQFTELAASFSEKEIKFIIECLMTAEEKMKRASILQLPLELAIIEICERGE